MRLCWWHTTRWSYRILDAKGGGVSVAREIEIHADTGSDVQLVRDGVLVGREMGIPCHASAAERGIPTLGCKIIEQASTMGELWDELVSVPATRIGFVHFGGWSRAIS